MNNGRHSNCKTKTLELVIPMWQQSAPAPEKCATPSRASEYLHKLSLSCIPFTKYYTICTVNGICGPVNRKMYHFFF